MEYTIARVVYAFGLFNEVTGSTIIKARSYAGAAAEAKRHFALKPGERFTICRLPAKSICCHRVYECK